jgi:hypothetical protein
LLSHTELVEQGRAESGSGPAETVLEIEKLPQREHTGLFADIGENRDRPDPQIPGLTRDAFGLPLIGARDDHDMRAFAGQLQHGRTADIEPRSGD